MPRPIQHKDDLGWTGENAAGAAQGAPPKVVRDADGQITTKKQPERALLAALLNRNDVRHQRKQPLGELAALADTAGVLVVGEPLIQKRDRPSPATCVFKGAVEQLAEQVDEFNASVVIFDNELAPRQRRNLEKVIARKVIDRTELILDIFASHARTPQAKLQVEVAQLEYALPRLRKMWSHLDPGIGLRGPGEKQLELDKRLVRLRIQELKRDLDKVRARKEREVKTRGEAFTVAVVGYTNAGKSTLMNALTRSNVLVADQLFATLDTRTRTWRVGSNRDVLISDTVGFIRHLPHRLVESFHATLEEVLMADLLLHVVDASEEQPLEQVAAVREVLAGIGAGEKPELIVLNKLDLATPEQLPILEANLEPTIRVSAKTGLGLEALRDLVNDRAGASEADYRITIDVREGKAIAFLQGACEIKGKLLDGETLEFNVRARAWVPNGVMARLRDPQAATVVASDVAD